ncbi:MAG: hypothetical protein KY475_10535 [Planctomycetes bacterium]|nr:hypothetical protein [Planctomycetota bacterium]
MNKKAFYRKVAYFAAIAVLLLPLSWLGQPPAGVEGRGRELAELRREHNLSQAELGDIDPASETMRLATLGLTGVAANILWHKAIEYHTMKDWSNFMAAANQIIKLQPNFIKVWEFQGHNISYNTSVEFDDYKYRYAWVKRGIGFLIEGARYNRDEPRLLSYTGHFFGQKIARSDERRQFRRLFAQDRDFHDDFNHLVYIDDAIGQSGYPDNWLVSRLWYLRAQNVVDTNPDRPLRGESPLIFHSHPPKSRINYAIDNEKDGYHGERARRDWERAYREYALEYGSREIPTSFGHTLRLNERERVLADAERLSDDLENVAGVTFEQLQEAKKAKLDSESREALDTPEEERTGEQHNLAYQAIPKTRVEPSELAEHAPADQRREAERLAQTIADLHLLADRVDRYRNIVNFNYWKTRAEVEMTELADRARQLVHEAEDLYRAAKLVETDGEPGAKEKFEEAWQAWTQLFQQHPDLVDDEMAADLVPAIRMYENVLHQIGEELPENFLMSEVLETHDEARARLDSASAEEKKEAPEQEPGAAGEAEKASEPEDSQTDAPATPAADETPADDGAESSAERPAAATAKEAADDDGDETSSSEDTQP